MAIHVSLPICITTRMTQTTIMTGIMTRMVMIITNWRSTLVSVDMMFTS